MTEQTPTEQTQQQPAPLARLVRQIMANAHNSDSIRYDLSFQQALIAFTDAQLAAEMRPGEHGETLEESAAQRFRYMILVDLIDIYAERLVEARLKAAGLVGNG